MAASFTNLADEKHALIEALHIMGMGRGETIIEIRALSGGVSSNIFAVEMQDRTVCLKQALPKLRVDKSWYVPTDRVFAEIAWLQVAAKLIPEHVPAVLGVDESRGAFVMEFLPAASYPNWKSELMAERVDLEVGKRVGDILGRTHAGTAHDRQISARFANGENFFALRLDPYLIEAARSHPELASPLIELVHVTQSNAHTLIHGDVSPKNILLGNHGPVFLDAECATYGDPAFDLAFLLNHVLLKGARRASATHAMSGLYGIILDAYRPHVTWESQRTFEARVAALLPGLLLARVDGKSPVEYLDASQRERVRTIAKSMFDSPSGDLTLIADRFLESCWGASQQVRSG